MKVWMEVFLNSTIDFEIFRHGQFQVIHVMFFNRNLEMILVKL